MNIKDVSYNFKVAKVVAILMVTIYHYTDLGELEFILWIPTAFALFIFAFSSGFFTSVKYRYPFNIKKFWAAKAVRLLYPILVIDVFLFILFIFQQRTGIFTWQTLFSLVGLNGIFGLYNNISNPSPFGAGLWFFTLLILFYLLYPLISILNKNRLTAIVFLLFILLATSYFQWADPSAPLFWLTQFAFILGAYAGVYEHNISPSVCIAVFTASCLLMLLLNAMISTSFLNYTLVIIASISIVGYLLNTRLPDFFFNKVILLSGCIIHIYFIHSYLYIHSLTKYQVIDYAISMVIVIAIALTLSRITTLLRAVTAKLQIAQ